MTFDGFPFAVPLPEGSGSAGRLEESGSGIGLRLCLALLPPKRPTFDFTAFSPKGGRRAISGHGHQTVSVSGSDSLATDRTWLAFCRSPSREIVGRFDYRG